METHTTMSVSEKSDDMVREQEKSLFLKKKNTEMKADGQIQFFWPVSVLCTGVEELSK